MNQGKSLPALKAAFPYTVPIFAGFWFLGITYGIYMHALGFSAIYPTLMSMCIFAGSMEFVAASLLLAPFAPLAAFIMTIMINARHLFYGISMLEKYANTGLKKIYLIFGMCDETFSLNYSLHIPNGVDKGWFYFWITFLNYSYWVSGAAIGGICGEWLNIEADGLGFAMTAMFVVILVEQWLNNPNHRSILLGGAISLVSLMIFGADNFIVPAMLGMLLVLIIIRPRKKSTKELSL